MKFDLFFRLLINDVLQEFSDWYRPILMYNACEHKETKYTYLDFTLMFEHKIV